MSEGSGHHLLEGVWCRVSSVEEVGRGLLSGTELGCLAERSLQADEQEQLEKQVEQEQEEAESSSGEPSAN